MPEIMHIAFKYKLRPDRKQKQAMRRCYSSVLSAAMRQMPTTMPHKTY